MIRSWECPSVMVGRYVVAELSVFSNLVRALKLILHMFPSLYSRFSVLLPFCSGLGGSLSDPTAQPGALASVGFIVECLGVAT